MSWLEPPKLHRCPQCKQRRIPLSQKYCSKKCANESRIVERSMCENGCGKRVSEPRNKCCSVECARELRSRKTYAKTAHIKKPCENCGKLLKRKWLPDGSLEPVDNFTARRYCDRDCVAEHAKKRNAPVEPEPQPEPEPEKPKRKSWRTAKVRPELYPVLNACRKIPELGEAFYYVALENEGRKERRI